MQTKLQVLLHPDHSRKMVISQAIVNLKAGLKAALTKEEAANKEIVYDIIIPTDPSPLKMIPRTREYRADRNLHTFWNTCDTHYREHERATFESNWRTLQSAFDQLINNASADYALWLKADSWQLRQYDFDGESHVDQILLTREYGKSLECGPTPQGECGPMDPEKEAAIADPLQEVWNSFLGRTATDRQNPIYIALFGNNQIVLDYFLPSFEEDAPAKPGKILKIYFIAKVIVMVPTHTDSWKYFVRSGFKINWQLLNRQHNPINNHSRRTEFNKALSFFTWIDRMVVENLRLTILGAANGAPPGIFGGKNGRRMLWLQEAAEIIFDRTERGRIILKWKTTVGEYLKYLRQGKGASPSKAAKWSTKNASGAAAQIPEDLSAEMADKKIEATIVVDDPSDRPGRSGPQHHGGPDGAFEPHPHSMNPKSAAYAKKMSLGSAWIRARADNTARLVRADVGMIGIGQTVLGIWALADSIRRARSTFVSDPEAQWLVVSGSLLTVGGLMETVGAYGQVFGKSWKFGVTRIASEFIVAAVIIEGFVNIAMAVRFKRRGDDAGDWYWLTAGLLLAASAVIGLGVIIGNALWITGPGTIFLIAAMLTGYIAKLAEDSPIAIWLDRCCWGTHSRWNDAKHPLDRPWTTAEIDDELAHLDALTYGVVAELGFEDELPTVPSRGNLYPLKITTGLWKFKIKMRLTLPSCNPWLSAYQWELRLLDDEGQIMASASDTMNKLPIAAQRPRANRSAFKTRFDLTKPTLEILYHQPDRFLVAPTFPFDDYGDTSRDTTYVIHLESEIRPDVDRLELRLDYVPDAKSNPDFRASLQIEVDRSFLPAIS